MKIDKETVSHIARLARLSVDDDDREMFAVQLSRILDHIDKISELDLTDVEPMSHAVELSDVTRPDEARPSLDVETALSNAPHREDDQFRVLRII